MSAQNRVLELAGHQLAAVCLNPGAAGEPVILLHGITGTISFWQVNPARYLLDVGPCYSLSLPGHFPAVAPAAFKQETLTAQTLVHLLGEAICRLVGERPVTLMGHSTGGFAALALASGRPELARRVISLSGFAHGRWIGILGLYQRAVRLGLPGSAFFKLMYRMLWLHPALYRWAMRFYAADVPAMYSNPDLAEAVEKTFSSFQRMDLDAMVAYFRAMPQIDIMAQMARIAAPALILTGDCDPIVPPEQSYEIARQIQGAELAVIRGAGHLPFVERPEDYNNALSGWLARTNR